MQLRSRVLSTSSSGLVSCFSCLNAGAPLGSLLGSHLHRLVLASLIYLTDGVQFIGALVIVRPWSHEKTDTPL